MNTKSLLILLSLALISSCTTTAIRLENRVQTTWQYNYSSDVIYGKVIKNWELTSSNDKECKFNVTDIEVLEPFKGNYQIGQIFTAIQIKVHETSEKGSEHILFMKEFSTSEYPGYEACQLPKKILSIHNWCCSIVDKNNKKNLLMYDMIHSELASDYYYVDANLMFEKLRTLKNK